MVSTCTVALRPSAVPPFRRPPGCPLLHATDRGADDLLSGRYDHLLPAGGAPADRRWFTRLHGDDELDIWLISWVPGSLDRTARPRRLAGRADTAVRLARRIPLGR